MGANYETGGRWSANDRDVFFGQILESTNNDVQAAQKVIFLKGGERYIDMLTHGQLLDHMMNKTAVVFADVKNSIGDFRDDFQVEEQNDVRYQVLLNIILIYYYSLVSVLVCFMIWAYKNKVKQYCAKNQFFVFAMITFVGLFAASMLVEVMNRYSLPFIAMLVIFAVNAIWDMSSKVAVKY